MLLCHEYIIVNNSALAEIEARRAMEYFTSVGDQYGIRIASLNLAAALSGITGSEEEAAELTSKLDRSMDISNEPRARAVLCNILTRRHRENGNTRLAASFAEEAISIGEQLGDLHVIAINHINLGNVRRDDNSPDLALQEYQTADSAAVTGGFRHDEAFANELIASMYNEQREFGLAATHAQHASGLARLLGDANLTARAEEENAIALSGQNDPTGAVNAYKQAALAIDEDKNDESLFVSLVSDGLVLCARSGQLDLMSQFLVEIFARDQNLLDQDSELALLEAVYGVLPTIAQRINNEEVVPLIALIMSTILIDTPMRIEHRIILQSINTLLASELDITPESISMCISAILMSSSWETLTLSTLADIAERIANRLTHLYFKPQSDGAAHWTIRLELGTGVVATIGQLDDSPQGAVIAMVTALLLGGMSSRVRTSILEADDLPRNEFMINITNRVDFEAQIDPEMFPLGELQKGFAVTSSTDLARDDQPPIIVIFEDSFGEPWNPSKRRVSDIHLLLAEILRGMAYHLLSEAIEPEVLYPKIMSVVKKIGFWGELENGPG